MVAEIWLLWMYKKGRICEELDTYCIILLFPDTGTPGGDQ